MIDVLIAAKDASWCLPDCIESIEAQTVKPDTVWIGVDQCADTADTAQLIQQESALDIRVVYFPSHSWPFRIKNTLALLSTADTLCTFDSDDIMYPRHIELMTKALDGRRFARAMADIEEDGERRRWDKAHGVTAIRRAAFILMGGFEAWDIAGDTEALHRWQACGLSLIAPKESTMLVRKHDRSLTINSVTGYGSERRRERKAEIRNRIVSPVRLDTIAVAPFIELVWPDAAGGIMPPIVSALPTPQGEVVVDAQGLDMVRYLLRHMPPSFERREREVRQRAEAWVERVQDESCK